MIFFILPHSSAMFFFQGGSICDVLKSFTVYIFQAKKTRTNEEEKMVTFHQFCTVLMPTADRGAISQENYPVSQVWNRGMQSFIPDMRQKQHSCPFVKGKPEGSYI